MNQETKDKVIELRNQGMGCRSIAKACLVSRDNVRDFLRTKYAQNLTKHIIAPKAKILKTTVCKNCGKEYHRSDSEINSMLYCSLNCKREQKNQRAQAHRRTKMRVCKSCGQYFYAPNNSVYCSDQCRKKISICECCGKAFETEVYNNKKYCSKECRKSNVMKSHKDYCIEILNIHHGNLLPITLYNGSDNDITMHCLLCGKQTIRPAAKFTERKLGCQNCGRRVSTAEDEISNYLRSNGIDYISQYRFMGTEIQDYRYDFAIMQDDEVKLLIEYDGVQHTKPIDVFGGEDEYKSRRARDEAKTQFAIDHNIHLIRINHNQRNYIENILDNVL